MFTMMPKTTAILAAFEIQHARSCFKDSAGRGNVKSLLGYLFDGIHSRAFMISNHVLW